MKLTPYQPSRPENEAEILSALKHFDSRNPDGTGIYEMAHIQTLLHIIERQEKEIKHYEKHLTRLQAWKNKFWLSILKIEKSGYYRKNGLQGKRFFGYSVRVLGKEII